MRLCLTSEELEDLTEYKHRSKQMQALVEMKIDFRLTPSGKIKVLRSDVDTKPDPGRTEHPDYGAA